MSGAMPGPAVLLVASFPDSILHFRGALMDRLRACGLSVHVAAPGLAAGSDMHRQLVARGFRPHDIALQRTGRNPLRDVFAMARLWRLMRRIRPRIVLSYTIKPVIYGSLAGWLARVPHRFALITGLGYAFAGSDSRPLTRRLAAMLYAAALARVQAVIFQNRDDESLFRETGILAPQARTVVVNGSGIDLARYAFSPTPGGGCHFLMICRLLGDKGVREYAEAARLVRAQHPGVRFSLAGWIDDSPDAISREELDAWVADGVLEYHGRREDVRPLLRECSVYVLPSYREGMPRTVLEAMATGRAVITTDAPGCRETVEDGVNGLLVPVGSAAALAEAMGRFIADPGLAGRMGLRSRALARERFDVARVNERMLEAMGIPCPEAGPDGSGD